MVTGGERGPRTQGACSLQERPHVQRGVWSRKGEKQLSPLHALLGMNGHLRKQQTHCEHFIEITSLEEAL